MRGKNKTAPAPIRERNEGVSPRNEGVSPPQLYRVKEVAEILKVDRTTVYWWIYSGKIAVRRTPGGSPLFTLEDIEEIIEKRSTKNGQTKD